MKELEPKDGYSVIGVESIVGMWKAKLENGEYLEGLPEGLLQVAVG